MTESLNPLVITAVHEGGHAIVATVLNVRFESVEHRVDVLGESFVCGGALRGADLPEGADNERLRKQLLVVVAGFAAQSFIDGTTEFSLSQFRSPDDRDYLSAVEILGMMQPPVMAMHHLEPALCRAWHDARELVHSNWYGLTVIANESIRRAQSGGQIGPCHTVLTPMQLSQLFSDA